MEQCEQQGEGRAHLRYVAPGDAARGAGGGAGGVVVAGAGFVEDVQAVANLENDLVLHCNGA